MWRSEIKNTRKGLALNLDVYISIATLPTFILLNKSTRRIRTIKVSLKYSHLLPYVPSLEKYLEAYSKESKI